MANLEAMLEHYRGCPLSKQTVVHEACHDCPLFAGLLTEGQNTWTWCDLLSEAEAFVEAREGVKR